MAYLALYRKWRPSTFEEVIGQNHVAIPLKRSLMENRLAHAYLFSGPRGTGKTSMARILAKAVNCLNPHGVDPCNECENCKEINSGTSMDVYEIDAASNRGIDDIRALRESVRSLPSSSKKKVYIIDEVHMLSTEAFNALLKTLEEPPEHVLFILATTDPQKIPVTILSRCQSYEFHRISVKDITEHLLHIAETSGFSLSPDAAGLIAVKADGGLRDALSLLDKCLGSSDGKEITADLVYDLLGLSGKDDLMKMATHIFQHKKGEVLNDFYSLLQNGKEVTGILSELLSYIRDLMIAKAAPESEQLLAYGAKLPEIKKLAASLDDSYLDSLFNTLEKTYSDARRTSSPRLTAETGLLRLARTGNASDFASIIKRMETLEQEISELKKNGIAAVPAKDSVSIPQIEPPAVPEPQVPVDEPPHETPSIPETEVPVSVPAAPAAKPVRSSRKKVETPVPRPETEPAATEVSSAPGSDVHTSEENVLPPATYPGVWQKVIDYVRAIPRIDVVVCFQQSRLIYATGSRAVISQPQHFLVEAGNNKNYQKVIADAFQHITGVPYFPRSVDRGSSEEAEALSLAKDAVANPSSAASAPSAPAKKAKADYQKITRDEIPPEDLQNKALSEALKIIPDCDIYEKIED